MTLKTFLTIDKPACNAVWAWLASEPLLYNLFYQSALGIAIAIIDYVYKQDHSQFFIGGQMRSTKDLLSSIIWSIIRSKSDPLPSWPASYIRGRKGLDHSFQFACLKDGLIKYLAKGNEKYHHQYRVQSLQQKALRGGTLIFCQVSPDYCLSYSRYICVD